MCNECSFLECGHVFNRISFSLAFVLSVISLIFSWIGFSVPDWLTYSTANANKKFGLLAVCTQSKVSLSNGYSCVSWLSGSESVPGIYIKNLDAPGNCEPCSKKILIFCEQIFERMFTKKCQHCSQLPE